MNYNRRAVVLLSSSCVSQIRVYSQQIKKIVKRGGFGRYKVASSISDSSVTRGFRLFNFQTILNRLKPLIGLKTETHLDHQKILTMDLDPPGHVRGMTTLDREAFNKTVTVPTLKIPVKQVGPISRTLRKVILKVPRIQSMIKLADEDPAKEDFKLVLINPETHSTLDKFTPEQLKMLKEHGVELNIGAVGVDLAYENWSAPDIIRSILPEEAGGFGGFSIIGHIVHLNLKDSLLPFKEIIGQVLLDKVVGAKTIVNKTNVIDNTYRNFQMDVIAGEANFETYSKENGCKFEMDFSKVYWNPRLGTEHERIIKILEPGDIVYDVFAGIGPFAVPASKKKCKVLANDLNPESFKWLEHNFRINKAKPEFYRAFNKDGRDFINEDVRKDILEVWHSESGSTKNVHITMNLPALAVEFLDAFKGLFKDVNKSSLSNLVLPRIYCYTFSKCDNPENDAKLNVEQKLGLTFSSDDWVRRVRNVAPNKEMLCASCIITGDVLFGENQATSIDNIYTNSNGINEPPNKKVKAD